MLELHSFMCFAHPKLLSAELEAWFDSNSESNHVLAFLIYEFFPGTPNVIETLTCIRELAKNKNKKLTVIADNQYKQFEHLWAGIDIVYISYWAMFVKVLSNPPDTEWNRNADKALFLTGKMHYINRIGALASAVKSGIISKLNYSFMYANEKFDSESKNIITQWDLDDTELMQYLLQHRGITDLETTAIPTTRVGFKDFEFFCDLVDPSMYAATRVSLVSESATRTMPTITEKVWKAIAFSHPFVLMAVPGTHEYLESIGVSTYSKFFPSTVEIGDKITKEQVDNALDNISWILQNQENDDEISEVIKQNKKQFELLAASAIKIVNDTATKFNVPTLMNALLNRGTADVYKLREGLVARALLKETELKDAEWKTFYNTLKGSDWPEYAHWSNLPLMVLDEIGVDRLSYFVPSLPPQSEVFLKHTTEEVP
jgi:hypothetical protein